MFLSFFTLLPAVFLAGFLFPLEAMPQALQWISYVVPLRYMMIIVRGIILKGVGLRVLAGEVIALAIFGVVIFSIAAKRFRKQLE
jgi:ABC-2 type transport system permease protein